MTTEGPDTARQKLDVMREILDGGIAMVHLDPRRTGVQVPERFRKDPVLRLNFAYGFRLPALTIDDEGVYAILNFQGERAACNIPWSAVFAITAPEHEHTGRLWPEDVPEEVVSELVAQASRARMREVSVTEGSGEKTRPDRPRPRRPPPVHAAPPAAATPAAATPETPEEGAPAPVRTKGHLRIVK